MDGLRITDADGNEYEVVASSGCGFNIRADGVVEYFSYDEDGNCEEWTEPLWRSAVRDAFPDWLWDEMDDALDPRNERS